MPIKTGKVKRILIFLGGSDPGNVTKKVLEAIKCLNYDLNQIDVVIGHQNINRDSLRHIVSKIPKAVFHNSINIRTHNKKIAQFHIQKIQTNLLRLIIRGIILLKFFYNFLIKILRPQRNIFPFKHLRSLNTSLAISLPQSIILQKTHNPTNKR